MTPKLELIRVFAAVVETGNITAAAKALSKTASSVSMSLKRLEEALGGPLFEGDRKNQLTELGRFAHEVARAQLENYERAVASIQAFARNETGHLSIACVESQLSRLLPRVVQHFLSDRADGTFELSAGNNGQIAERVVDQAIDLGICAEPGLNPNLIFEPLLTDPFHVWFSRHSALAKLKRPLTWRDLRSHRLLRNPVSDTLSTETYRNLAMRSKLWIQDTASLMTLVSSGSGIAILPLLPLAESTSEVLHLPLNDHRAHRVLGLVRRAHTPVLPGVDIFSRQLRSSCEQFQQAIE